MTRVLDPYLSWAGLTRFRYLATQSAGENWAAGPIHLAGVLLDTDTPLREIAIAGLAVTAPELRGARRFFSATLQPVTQQSLAAVHEIADFVLAEPGMQAVDQPPGVRPAAVTVSASHAPDAAPLPNDVVIGVIDGRCGFLNKCFCDPLDPKSSRIGYFWDQSKAPAGPWTAPSGLPYGRELTGAALNAQLAGMDAATASGTAREAFERRCYEVLDHALPGDADWSHGTHVLDTALSDYDVHAPAGVTVGLVYVQLPDTALRDTSSRWTAANVLDGMLYILARARGGAKIVINLSLGSFAGPHDGSSVLERAIDSLVEEYDGRLTVVVAAGNAGCISDDGSGTVLNCHGSFELDAVGSEGPNAN